MKSIRREGGREGDVKKKRDFWHRRWRKDLEKWGW